MIYCARPHKTWDELDDYWLKRIDQYPNCDRVADNRGRRRVFHRIFHQATDPKHTRGLGGRTLVEQVRKSGEHPDATALYDSSFWRLVGPKPLTPAEILVEMDKLIDTLGLFQASPAETSIASVVGIEHLAFSNQNLEHIRIAAAHIARRGTIDAISLLGCCFQRALDNFSLREADVYLAAILRAYRKIFHRWTMQPEVATCLSLLIDVRLIRRLYVPIEPEWADFRVRRRKRNAPSLNIRPDLPLVSRMQIAPRMFQPVVAYDQTLQDFMADYPRLHGQATQRYIEAFAPACRNDDPDMSQFHQVIAKLFLGDASGRKSS